MTWINVSDLDDLKQKHQKCVEAANQKLLLIFEDNQVFAIENQCSHALKPLNGSKVFHKIIECPYHGARFCLKTGEHLSPPAFKGIKTYPVCVQGNTVSIQLET